MKLKLNIKKQWEVSQGPQPHRRGEIHADRRERRLRTRSAQLRRALNE